MKDYGIPHINHPQIRKWLEENIQENLHADSRYYKMSSISPFIEWRSKDQETWIVRISGFKPKMQIGFKDSKHEELFISQWVLNKE